MSTHAKFSPSRLPNLDRCPGWESDPTPGEAALRGTAVHARLAAMIHADLSLAVFPAIPVDLAQMVDTGLAIWRDLKVEFPDLSWYTEQKLDTGIPECYGTGDLIGVSEWSDVAVIVDWKTGRGERDDAGANLQTIAYSLGVLARWKHVRRFVCIMGELEQQPTRCEWTLGDMLAGRDRILAVIAAAERAIVTDFRPSDKACQYCAERNTCPARRKAIDETVEQMPAMPDPAQVSAVELSEALTKYRGKAKMIAAFIKELEDRAKAILQEGGEVPNYTLKTTAGGREWTAPEDVVVRSIGDWATSANLAGLPPLFELSSPAEVEKRIAAHLVGVKGAKKMASEAIAGLCKTTSRVSLVES